jgi:hypothetical protein
MMMKMKMMVMMMIMMMMMTVVMERGKRERGVSWLDDRRQGH